MLLRRREIRCGSQTSHAVDNPSRRAYNQCEPFPVKKTASPICRRVRAYHGACITAEDEDLSRSHRHSQALWRFLILRSSMVCHNDDCSIVYSLDFPSMVVDVRLEVGIILIPPRE